MKTYEQQLGEIQAWANETFLKIDKKLSAVTLRSRDKLADNVDECGNHKSVHPHSWVSGFWGGLNVLMYERTKNEEYLKTARRSEELLDEALFDFEKLYHDVGFMWHILSGGLYKLTGDERSKNRNLHAAASLFSRFILGGNYIRAWNDESSNGWPQHHVTNWTIIDCMMNLPILYWASDLIGDDRFKRIAMAHADNTIKSHIRPDGSVVHCAEHDRESGEVIETFGGQGYAVGSSWSRGQAWAIYGFMLSYLHTGEQRYLDTARRVADYFIPNVSDCWIPQIDFRAPTEPCYYDTTAGCIAACGFIELAKALPEAEGGVYMSAAINMLKAISEKFGDFDPAHDAMINGGSVRYPVGNLTPAEAGVNRYIVYADYYFTEAVLKLLGSTFNPWF